MASVASDIKGARYAMQVCACVIYKKLADAHLNSGSSLPILEWLDVLSTQSPMALYWKLIMELEVHILIYIRSIREGDFPLHVIALRTLMKWIFALDHIHYLRWLTVHLFDLVNLPWQHPDVYENFYKGYFTFNKSCSEFSTMALDQLHEQNNETIKGVGGATRLLNKEEESALIRWELCGSEVSNMIASFEERNEQECSQSSGLYQKHHEDAPAFRKRFVDDVQKLSEKFLVNPFESNDFTAVNNSRIVFDDDIKKSVQTISTLGETQFQEFWSRRLVKAEIPISEEVKKNNLRLPKHTVDGKSSLPKKDPILNAKMVSFLRSANQFRPEEVQKLFSSEIFGIPQSIAGNSLQLYTGPKSEILRRFKTYSEQSLSENSGIVIELSPIIKSKQKVSCTTFDQFAEVVYRHIKFLSKDYQRCDVVADRYFSGSLKEGTRLKRGDRGSTMNFTGETKFSANFSEFLCNSANKDKLGQFLAQKLIALHSDNPTKFVVTFNDGILTNDDNLSLQMDISCCTAEEADPRIIRHAINQANNGVKTIRIETIDTDVLVLSLSHVGSMIQAGANSIHTRVANSDYDLTELYNRYGTDICKALPYFYALTGCDTTSSFFGKGKTTCLDAWLSYVKLGEVVELFIALGNAPSCISVENLNVLEEFLMYLYFGKDNTYTDIDEARRISFFKSPDPKLNQTILSRGALLEHAKRAAYQAGWLWRECLTNVILPDPHLWGWKLDESSLIIRYLPRWQLVEVTEPNIDAVTSICSCKTNRCVRCKCGASRRKCLEYCNCQRNCNNV